MRNNIILIGFSFTGKSSVGKLVAERLAWRFLDLDREIIKKAGQTIPEIFSGGGERVFRSYEARVLQEVVQSENQVIATGGGVVISKDNRNLIKKSGLVVCLDARPETIYRRLLKDVGESSRPEERPLLSGENPLVKITDLKEKRRAYYQIAHTTIQTDSLPVETVASEVIRAWESYAKREHMPACSGGH